MCIHKEKKSLKLPKPRKRRSQDPCPGVVEPDPFAPQQKPLLVQRDALSVARPLALEPAQGASRGDDAVAGHLGSERVAAESVADGARRRAQVR